MHLHKPGACSWPNTCSATSDLTSTCAAGASSPPTPWLFHLHLHLCLPPPRDLLPPRHLSHPLHNFPMPLSAFVFVWQMLHQTHCPKHVTCISCSLCCHHDCASSLTRFLTSWALSYCLPSAVKSCSCKRSDNHSVPPLWHLTRIFLGWTPGGNCHHQPHQCLKSPPGTGTAVGVLGVCHAS